MNVKEWRPVEGCESCKQAARIFHKHADITAHTNALAINRIRELEAENALLQKHFDRAQSAESDVARCVLRAEAAEAKVADLAEIVKHLCRALKDVKGDEALKLTQAALNLAHVLQVQAQTAKT